MGGGGDGMWDGRGEEIGDEWPFHCITIKLILTLSKMQYL